jgi:hypothetical protein
MKWQSLSEEKIEGYILAGKVFVRKRNIHYILFFTSERLIAAKVGGQHEELTLIADSCAFARKAEELKDVSIESILKADKDNFEIPYTDITDIEIKKAGWKERLMSNVPALIPIGTMRIRIRDKEEQKFHITRTERMDPSSPSGSRPQVLEDCINIVCSVLSDKLSVKS